MGRGGRCHGGRGYGEECFEISSDPKAKAFNDDMLYIQNIRYLAGDLVFVCKIEYH